MKGTTPHQQLMKFCWHCFVRMAWRGNERWIFSFVSGYFNGLEGQIDELVGSIWKLNSTTEMQKSESTPDCQIKTMHVPVALPVERCNQKCCSTVPFWTSRIRYHLKDSQIIVLLVRFGCSTACHLSTASAGRNQWLPPDEKTGGCRFWVVVRLSRWCH